MHNSGTTFGMYEIKFKLSFSENYAVVLIYTNAQDKISLSANMYLFAVLAAHQVNVNMN